MIELEIRASRAPLAFRCPGSVREVGVPVSDDNYPSRLGTATHVILRGLAETGAVPWGLIDETAALHNVNSEEMRMLAGMAAKLWPSLAPNFPDALTEVFLSTEWRQIALTGHVDVLSTSGKAARLADWKTGRVDANHAQQMRAYTALALIDDITLTEATSTAIWIRDGEIENYTMTRDGLRVWLDDLVTRVLEWDGVYHPGTHCQFCPRSHECDAETALVRRDVRAISDRELVASVESDLASMPPADIIELHRKADMVKRYADRVDEAIKAYVLAHGELEGLGAKLSIDTVTRRELDPLKAAPVLDGFGFEETDYADCMELRISRVEKRVAQRAGRGNGAAAVRELTKKLEEADAIRTREIHQLKERRT